MLPRQKELMWGKRGVILGAIYVPCLGLYVWLKGFDGLALLSLVIVYVVCQAMFIVALYWSRKADELLDSVFMGEVSLDDLKKMAEMKD